MHVGALFYRDYPQELLLKLPLAYFNFSTPNVQSDLNQKTKQWLATSIIYLQERREGLALS
jgi:hypothetical protein